MKVDTHKYEERRGNPAMFSSGIRWFLVDGKKVQIHAPSWRQAQDLVIRLHPKATVIELLP